MVAADPASDRRWLFTTRGVLGRCRVEILLWHTRRTFKIRGLHALHLKDVLVVLVLVAPRYPVTRTTGKLAR